MANRPYLLTNSGDDMNDPFASRVLNDGEAEVLLLDLDRQAKIAAEYYKQRDACLTEIKDSKGSTSKVH